MNTTTAKDIRLEGVRKMHFLKEVLPPDAKNLTVEISRERIFVHGTSKGRPFVVEGLYSVFPHKPIRPLKGGFLTCINPYVKVP